MFRLLLFSALLVGCGNKPKPASLPDAPVTSVAEAEPGVLRCSFCGKSQHEVNKIIAGPSVYICDECVALCNEIIQEEKAVPVGEMPPVE